MISSLVNCVSRSAPSAGDGHEILDPDAALARQVDAGLDRHDVAGLQHVRRLRAEDGRLVDLDADAVPEPVTEGLAEAGRLDRSAGRRVRVAARDARTDGSEPRELGLETERVQVGQPLRDLADRERPGAVRAVAVEHAARVHDDEHALRDRAVAGDRVWRGARLPRRDDRGEGHVVRTALAKRPLDPPRQLALAAARESLLRERREDLVGERARAAQDLELGVVLHRPQRLDEARRRNGVHPRLLQQPEADVGHVRFLEGDAAPRDVLRDPCEQVARHLDEGRSFDLTRAGGVAKVREDGRAPVWLDQHGGVRAREPGQIPHVRLAAEGVRRSRDEQRLLEERREPLDPGHVRSWTRNSSASR